MRLLPLLVLLGIGFGAQAQAALPIVWANSRRALIREGADEYHAWSIDPNVKLDVHTLTKNPAPVWVCFRTDIDSIRVRLRPGQFVDFKVVLTTNDTCLTRLQSPHTSRWASREPTVPDTLAFVLTAFNNVKIKAVLNETDTLDLKFDSGTTGLLLTQDAIEKKLHAPLPAHNRLRLGNLVWDSLPVYPVALSGQGTDGRFGWDLFDGRVVEINYDMRLFIVHSRLPRMGKGYSRLVIEYAYSLFCIRARLEVAGKKYPNRFLFDNGYQRTLMLDTVLMARQHYPKNIKIIKKAIMKNGQGEDVPVLTINNERFRIGSQVLSDIPAQVLATANPARFTTHIVGNEVLKRFNTVLDFQHNFVYLKPNTLWDAPYADTP